MKLLKEIDIVCEGAKTVRVLINHYPDKKLFFDIVKAVEDNGIELKGSGMYLETGEYDMDFSDEVTIKNPLIKKGTKILRDGTIINKKKRKK